MYSKQPTGQLPISNPEYSMPQPANANQKQLWDYVNPLKNYPKSASVDVDLEPRGMLLLHLNMVRPSPLVLPLPSPAFSTRTRLELPIHYTTPCHPMIHIALGLLGCCLQIHTSLLLRLFLGYWVCPTLGQPQQQPTFMNLRQR